MPKEAFVPTARGVVKLVMMLVASGAFACCGARPSHLEPPVATSAEGAAIAPLDAPNVSQEPTVVAPIPASIEILIAEQRCRCRPLPEQGVITPWGDPRCWVGSVRLIPTDTSTAGRTALLPGGCDGAVDGGPVVAYGRLEPHEDPLEPDEPFAALPHMAGRTQAVDGPLAASGDFHATRISSCDGLELHVVEGQVRARFTNPSSRPLHDLSLVATYASKAKPRALHYQRERLAKLEPGNTTEFRLPLARGPVHVVRAVQLSATSAATYLWLERRLE